MTDNYFIDASAGFGHVAATAGSDIATAGALEVGGGPDIEPTARGGSVSSGAGSHAGGAITTAGSASTTAGSAGTTAGSAGSGEAGSGDAGSAGEGLGGTGGNGGQDTYGGGRSGGGQTAGGPSVPEPACKEGVTKGTTCTGPGAQLCYKSCGPDNMGYKPLTCQGGVYDELQSGCTFPPQQDYACYTVPPGLPTECPAGTPRGGQPCQIASCTVCFGGTSFNPQYQDSTATPKNGYCVCSQAGVWTCGTYPEAWPCTKGSVCH